MFWPVKANMMLLVLLPTPMSSSTEIFLQCQDYLQILIESKVLCFTPHSSFCKSTHKHRHLSLGIESYQLINIWLKFPYSQPIRNLRALANAYLKSPQIGVSWNLTWLLTNLVLVSLRAFTALLLKQKYSSAKSCQLRRRSEIEIILFVRV